MLDEYVAAIVDLQSCEDKFEDINACFEPASRIKPYLTMNRVTIPPAHSTINASPCPTPTHSVASP